MRFYDEGLRLKLGEGGVISTLLCKISEFCEGMHI